MKIIDGLNLKGKPAEIPDCSRYDLPDFFLEMKFQRGIEIGVDKGEFSEKFAKVGLQIYAVDPWHYNEDSTDQKRLNDLYNQTKKVLSPYPNCKIIRKTSMEAAKDFPDRSLDFVYIDGNHEFMFVTEDIAVWSKKVKIGGVISGHDYIYTEPSTPGGICHVIYVVNGYTKAYGIDNWYLLGRKKYDKGEKRDRFRSWMWINQEYRYRKNK